jgi:NADPH-dependent ferric siderophore reductase
MMNKLKQKALSLLERATAKTGHILDVKAWELTTIFEIDLHLPGVTMQSWQTVQHMKIKVADMTYRDYSPAMWDSVTNTCKLFIDAGHPGAGSNWVRQLCKGDTFTYLGVGPTPHKPVPAGQVFCLGDTTAIGHFLALEQLTENRGDFSGVIALNNIQQQFEFERYLNTNLETVVSKKESLTSSLTTEVSQRRLTDETVFMAGNIPAITQLRKQIRQLPKFTGAIKAQGFWS